MRITEKHQLLTQIAELCACIYIIMKQPWLELIVSGWLDTPLHPYNILILQEFFLFLFDNRVHVTNFSHSFMVQFQLPLFSCFSIAFDNLQLYASTNCIWIWHTHAVFITKQQFLAYSMCVHACRMLIHACFSFTIMYILAYSQFFTLYIMYSSSLAIIARTRLVEWSLLLCSFW